MEFLKDVFSLKKKRHTVLNTMYLIYNLTNLKIKVKTL